MWMLSRFFRWIEFPSFFLLKARTVKTDGKVERLIDLWVICDKENQQITSFRHVVRLYKLEQLRAWLENTGFSVKRIYGDYERHCLSPNSTRLIMVALEQAN